MPYTVKGIHIDTRELDRIRAELKPRAQAILADTAHAVEERAKREAPVDTGALRSSINSEQTGDYSWRVKDGVEYGIYQELGTSRMAAHPFLTPAVESMRQKFEKVWKELFT